MKQNEGKRFENNFRNSLDKSLYFYRLRDSGASFYGGNANLRFSNKNIADNIVFNGKRLFINELKAHAGKSLPLSCIRTNQVQMMSEASRFSNVICTLFVFFYDVQECYALDINKFNEYLSYTDRKSVPLSFFQENAIKIPVIPKKTNYVYCLNDFFK